jgi:TatD DNase family protein
VIDTHAHLDALDDPAEEVVHRASEAGVSRVITIGSGIESCRAALQIAESVDCVYAGLGIHPHQAGEGASTEELRPLFSSPCAVAVGETGLDYFRDYAPHDAQRALFDAHLALAAELEKPVVVHTRAANEDTLRVLEGFRGTVILHCFSEPELVDAAAERGYYVSFAGNLTYPNAADLRHAAAEVPIGRVLVETDSPHLAPQPCRGRRNEPAFLIHTLEALAAARGDDAGELEQHIDANATTAFALP